MNRDIQVINKLTAPHGGRESVLYPMISGRTRLQGDNGSLPGKEKPLWSAAWWGLEQSTVFQNLDHKTQSAALEACNRTLLNEAYFIEKSGLAYTAKMILLAETTDEAQIFALIGADEAKHLAWIEPYITETDKTHPYGAFLAFLTELVETYPPRLLVYLVQIILEGWGLDHYRRLSIGCQYPPLAQIFTHIIKDEALHHRSGSFLFKPSALNAHDITMLRDAMVRYADMVRVGPQTALQVLNELAGGLPQQDVEELLTDLGHETETPRKLSLLKSLMRQPGMEKQVDELDANGYFEPLPLQEAAQVDLAHPSHKSVAAAHKPGP